MSATPAAAPATPEAAPPAPVNQANGQAELLAAIRQTVSDQIAPIQQAHKNLQDQVNAEKK